MTPSKWRILIAALVLTAMTAAVLARVQAARQIGAPGLKMVDRAVLDENGKQINSSTIDFPADVAGYQSQLMPVSRIEVEWLPPDTTFARRRYRASDGFELMLSGVLMGTDRTSIHRPQLCLPGQGWKIEDTKTTTVRMARPHAYDLPVTRIFSSKTVQSADGSRRTLRSVYVYWFVADKHVTASHFERNWLMVLESVRAATLQRWAYISCFAACAPGQEEVVYRRLESFIQESVPEYQLATGPRRE